MGIFIIKYFKKLKSGPLIRKIGWILLAFFSLLDITFAQSENELIRTLSYDSGYSPSAYSNRAITHFGLELTQASSLLFDGVSSAPVVGDNPVGRTLWSIISFFAAAPLASAYSLSSHEFGHGTRLAAIGLKPEFIFIDDFTDTNQQNEAPTYDDFFSYFSNSLTQSGGGARASGESLFDLGSASQPNDWGAVITMGGLNVETTFADLIEETIYYQKGHAHYLPYYATAKLSAANYVQNEKAGVFGDAGGDLTSIVNFYKVKQFEISLDDIQLGSNNAFALSFSTYALLYSYWTYIVDGDSTTHTFEVLGFRLPDVDFYINRKGLSYKFKSGFRLSDHLLIPFALERIYEGDSFEEMSLGVRFQFDALYIQGGVIGDSSQGSLGVQFAQLIGFEAGLTHYDEGSLFGERNISTLENGTTFDEVWARISIAY